jgi:hypothetical protein
VEPGSSRAAAADAVKKRARHPGARPLACLGMLAMALGLCGCATPAPLGDTAPAHAAMPDTQRDLAAGVDLFDKGDYLAAIRSLLTSEEIWRGPLQTRVTAQKYVAFSHCLLKRPQPCKQSFSDLLRMKPDFELAAAEVGHPLWGAAFREAKREATAASSPQRAVASR